LATVRVDLQSEKYDIVVGSGVIKKLPDLLRPLIEPTRAMIISNTTVSNLHGDYLRHALAPLQCDILIENIPDGEQYKNMPTVEKLLGSMVQARLDRKSLILAFGGGVVGDVAGFAASIYMRGLPYVHIPTTLLAQVDSSIGGKVGIDHKMGKNLIGSFYQPILVCADTDVLKTLPENQHRNGLAEIIKYGVIADEGLFTLLERNVSSLRQLDNAVLADIIKRCCQIKARIIQQDVRETTGLRAILNYGHTIGHAIEAATEFTRYSHGEAVAIGMTAAAKIGGLLNLAPQGLEERQEQLISSAGLPTTVENVKVDRLLEAMLLDKKAAGGKITFVLPIKIGRGAVKENIPPEIVHQALREVGATTAE